MKKSVLIAMTVFFSTSVFAIEGYKDFKWGMSWDEIKATRACPQFAPFSKDDGIGYDCYKIVGKKRSLNFYLTGNNDRIIEIRNIK